jgi:deoxyribonuclease IV
MSSPAPRHRFGSHLSIAGGMYNAIDAALRLEFDTVQVFVKNQRQWRAAPVSQADVDAWNQRLATPGFGPVTAHATYLVNLASQADELFEKSRDAFADELIRCQLFAIPTLVVHPGAAGTQPRDKALARVALALNQIFEKHPQLQAMPLLETTAGQGSTLGRTFAELGAILRELHEPQRVGVCIDTCHVFAAGYDIRDPDAYARMMDEMQREVGIQQVRALHLNDSRGDCGSRLDRHEHIGRGCIGEVGFRNVLADERLLGLPMILETPKESPPEGPEWDSINLATLRRLAAGGPAAAAPSARPASMPEKTPSKVAAKTKKQVRR